MTRIKSLILSCALVGAASGAMAAEPITFQMSWKAQAEQGGYYQAVAKGFYAACGIDMTIRQGGPGIDTTQLLVGGAVQAALVSQNDGVMRMNEAGFKARAVMAGFQKFPSIFLAHPEAGINSFADMKGKPIMISQPNRNTFWPFLKAKFGYSDDQLRTYTGQIAVWMTDRNSIQQGVVTNEPFVIKAQTGEEAKYFLLADAGYTPYTSVVAVSQKMIDEKPQVVQCLVDASRKGWADFLKDPKPAFAAVQKENPQNTDELMAYSFAALKSTGLIESEDTAKLGIGTMTDKRWKDHFDMLVAGGLFKADFDYKSAYTLQFLSTPIN